MSSGCYFLSFYPEYATPFFLMLTTLVSYYRDILSIHHGLLLTLRKINILENDRVEMMRIKDQPQ